MNQTLGKSGRLGSRPLQLSCHPERFVGFGLDRTAGFTTTRFCGWRRFGQDQTLQAWVLLPKSTNSPFRQGKPPLEGRWHFALRNDGRVRGKPDSLSDCSAFGKVSFLSFTLQSRRRSGATAPLKGSLGCDGEPWYLYQGDPSAAWVLLPKTSFGQHLIHVSRDDSVRKRPAPIHSLSS